MNIDKTILTFELDKRKNLNIGCGHLKFDNCISIDKRDTPIVDFIMDLNNIPWPFEDEKFLNVYAYDIVEHLDEVVDVVNEIWRVLKIEGVLYIHTNHYKYENAFTDPTHKHFFSMNSFDFWDDETMFGTKYPHYADGRIFRIETKMEDGQEIFIKMIKKRRNIIKNL